MGQTCVPHHPQRIVSISQFTLGNALTLDVKPIASTMYLAADVSKDYLFPKYLKNRTAGIKPVGSQLQPNLEKILLLKPDLIVGWEPVKEIYPLLSKIAPTVLGDWQNLQKSWQEHLNFVAQILGKEEVAQAAWNHYYQRIKELKIALGSRYQNQEIAVAYIGKDGIISYVKNSFDGWILNDVGLQRPKAQDVNSNFGRIENISAENLDQIDGDILFVMTGDINKRELLKTIQAKPLWQKLRAVQQNHVYFVDDTTWLGGTLLAAEAVIDDLFKYLVNIP
jgi:iron complex transport system substrate-binding protein